MKRLRILALILIATVIAGPVVFASDITGSKFFAQILISNNGTAVSNVGVPVPSINSTVLINGLYANATVNNTSLRNTSGADLAFMPGSDPSYPWVVFVPFVGQDGYLTEVLYLADATGGKMRYFPGATGMEVADNNTLLEPSANFSIVQAGFVDTTAGAQKYLTDKPLAIRVAVSGGVDGEIEVSIPDDDCLDYVRGNGDWTRSPDDAAFSFTAGGGVDEPFTFLAWVNWDDATGSPIIAKGGGVQYEWIFTTRVGDTLQLRILDPAAANEINASTLAVTADEGTWHHYAATYDGTELNTGIELYRDGVNATNARAGAGVYVGMTDGTADVNLGAYNDGAGDKMEGQLAETKVYAAELTPAEILTDYNGGHRTADLVAWWRIDEGAGLPQDSSGNAHHATLNLADWVNTFTQRFSAFLTATGITSDEHVIEVNADSVNMTLILDGTIEDEQPLGGFSVPNVADNWTFVWGAAMPYMEYHQISIGGNLRQYIEWAYDTLIFYDGSGNDQDAYPSFLTTAIDPDVSGNMTGFLPVSEAQAPPYALGPVNPFLSDTSGNITGNFTIVPPVGGFPLAGVIVAMANATSTPSQLPLLIVAGFVILAASLTTTYFLRKYGAGSILIKSLVIVCFLGIFVGLKNFGVDFWMLLSFGIFAAGLSMMSRQQGWN